MKKIVLAIGLLGGAAIGEAGWQGDVRSQAVTTPSGWIGTPIPVPYRLTELSGDLPHQPDAWSLDFKQEIRPVGIAPDRGPASLAGTVLLPEDGQIELWAAAPIIQNAGAEVGRRHSTAGGVALILERIEEPSSAVYITREDGRERLQCSSDLSPPTDEAVRVSITPTNSGVDVRVGDSETSCIGTVGDFAPALVPGLRRVSISDLEVGGQQTPNPERLPRGLWWMGGALLALFGVWLELFNGARASIVALSTTPLLGAYGLAGTDFQLWAETARMTWLPVAWLPALLPLGCALLVKCAHHLGRALKESESDANRRDWSSTSVVAAGLPLIWSWATGTGQIAFAVCIAIGTGGCVLVAWLLPYVLRWWGSQRPVRTASLIVASGTVLGLLMGSTIPNHRIAILLSGCLGLTLSALIWANANASRIRLYNIGCLLLMTGSFAIAEGAIRYTPAGNLWAGRGGTIIEDDIYGWVQQANRDFACFDQGEYQDYPMSCFPTRPDMADGRIRIVSMGGSSTAGANDNDDISEFYPAMLESQLEGRAQVINQGVGGWTTFQIHRYLLDNLQSLEPDVLTFYIGHNDILTSVPIPYSELYQAWQHGQGRQISESLRDVRLYQALRYLLTSLRPAQRRVAVPTADARIMLEEIIEIMEQRGGTVILASEGLDPSPGPMAEYNEMLEELANVHDNTYYVDTASRLHDATDDAFFDDCHLKEAGHNIVADAIYEELERTGVLSP